MAAYTIATQGPSTLVGAVGHAVQIATANLARSSATTTYYLRAADGTPSNTTSAATMAAAVAAGAVVERTQTS